MTASAINFNPRDIAVQRSQGSPRQEVASARIKQSANEQAIKKWSGFKGFIQYIIACLVCWFSCSMSFREACANGKVRLVTSQWIKEDIQPDEINQGIRDAYNNGKFEVILALAAKGVSTVLNDRGDSILRHAIQDGHTQFALQLIEVRVDVNTAYQSEVDGPIEHPLEVACRKGSVEVAAALLKAGANAKAAFVTLLEEENSLRTLVNAGYDFTGLQFSLGMNALHYASRAGLVWLVKMLLLPFGYNGRGNLLNATDARNRTALDLALQCKDVAGGMQVARLLLQNRATATTGLQTAMEKDLDKDIVETLVRSKQNLNGLNEFGLAPIHVATQKKDTALIALLSQNGAKLDLKTADGKTALQIAFEQKDAESAKCLIQQGASVEGLLLVAYANEMPLEVMKLIVERSRGDLNGLNQDGYALVHLAIMKRDAEFLQCLLQKGASPDVVDGSGKCALQIALITKNAIAVSLLLRSGANRQAVDEISLSQVLEAGDMELFKILIDNGALNAVSVEERQALFIKAVEIDKELAALCLINKGVSLDIPDANGNYLLHHLAVRASPTLLRAVVELMKEKGVNLDQLNAKGLTALRLAIKHQRLKNAAILVKAGVNTSIQDKNGNTVFHAAVYRHQEILRTDNSGRVTCPLQYVVSQQNRAGLNIANKKGQTPLYLAVKSGNVMLVRYLVSLGVERDHVLQIFENRLSPEMTQALVPQLRGSASEATQQRGFFAEVVSEFFGQA